MNDIENRAREYIAEHSEYSEVFGETFIAVDTLTAMVEFSKQETKELEKENAELKKELKKWKDAIYADVENYDDQLTKAKELLQKCLNTYLRDPELRSEVEGFLKELEK